MPVEEWRDILDIDAVLKSYMDSALWASVNMDTERSLDADYGPGDIAPETKTEMMADIVRFLNSLDIDDIEGYLYGEHYTSGIGNRRMVHSEFEPQSENRLGFDLFLTRNGHGAGFWDRGLGIIGKRFTEAAKDLGEIYLYVGDDGKIYQQDA